jgi:hypothetical protein
MRRILEGVVEIQGKVTFDASHGEAEEIANAI